MADPILSNWDIFFRVWAVVGPLLAGAASQLWERNIKIRDREFEFQKENMNAERENKAKEKKFIKERKLQDFLDTKSCYIKFMSSSHEYVRAQSDHLSYIDDQEKYIAASNAYGDLVRSQQELILLCSTEIENASIRLLNAANRVPKSYRDLPTEDYSDILNEYQEARISFNALAKAHLQEISPIDKPSEG